MMNMDFFLVLIAGFFLGFVWGEYRHYRGEIKGLIKIISFLERKKIIGIRDGGETYLIKEDGTPGKVLWGKRGIMS